jgi:ABC-2 type transport system ATP-binding protein
MMGLLDRLAGQGRVVLFSSHILEEVEQVSGTVQVMVAGRLAASGDFRTIRRLMTNRPHVYTIRSSDDRRLAVALMAEPSVRGVDLHGAGRDGAGRDGAGGEGAGGEGAGLEVRVADYGTFTRRLPRIAVAGGIRIRELLPADESLESVFSYLIAA